MLVYATLSFFVFGFLFTAMPNWLGVTPVTRRDYLLAGLPLAAMLTTAEIEDEAARRGFLFYTTHASDPLPAAVGLKVIEVILRDRLTERAAELGAEFGKG